VSMIQHKNQ